jgi:hypothetical protein
LNFGKFCKFSESFINFLGILSNFGAFWVFWGVTGSFWECLGVLEILREFWRVLGIFFIILYFVFWLISFCPISCQTVVLVFDLWNLHKFSSCLGFFIVVFVKKKLWKKFRSTIFPEFCTLLAFLLQFFACRVQKLWG